MLKDPCRAVGRSENPGVPVLFGGHICPLGWDRVAELDRDTSRIGLTNLQKSGGVMAPPAPPGTTSLQGIGKKKIQRIYIPKGLGGSIGHVKVNWIFLTLRCQKSFQFS